MYYYSTTFSGGPGVSTKPSATAPAVVLTKLPRSNSLASASLETALLHGLSHLQWRF